jgi:hypothetical protein
MSFRVTGLDPSPFVALYGLADDRLRARGARRVQVDATRGVPDRVELRDLEPGEVALLVNHLHQPADTPYRASHAIYVREGATAARCVDGRLPTVMAVRLLSLRAFDAAHMMVDADVVHGAVAAPRIDAMLADPRVAYLHAHYAKPGCYAARIDRLAR